MEKTSRSLGELGACLCIFAEEASGFSAQHKTFLESSNKIGTVLDELEKVVKLVTVSPIEVR